MGGRSLGAGGMRVLRRDLIDAFWFATFLVLLMAIFVLSIPLMATLHEGCPACT
jgi:hypothetical protein